MSNEEFLKLLEAYYGRLQPIHRKALWDWLGSKRFGSQYLGKLYQEIIASYSTKYGKPCDLASVMEVHKGLIAYYVPPAETLEDRNQRLIGERVVSREEGEQILATIAANLAKKKRVKRSYNGSV